MSRTDVTLECPRCRAYKIVPRTPELPSEVRLIEIICPDCDDGDFHSETWFESPGVEVSQGSRSQRMSLSFAHGSGLVPGRVTAPPSAIGPLITEAIEAAMVRADIVKTERRIGASALGDPCLRKLVYKYLRTPERPPEGRMRRIWARGHAAEDRIIGWLRQAGFHVVNRVRGQQIGFQQLGNRIAGRIDGIVLSGPVEMPYPVMLELKCLGSKSWNNLVKHGLAISKEVYFAQIHLYLAYLDLCHCLFGAENADTMEIWWDLVPFDIMVAQQASDRGVQVVQMGDAGELPPRIATAPDFWLCRMCEFAGTCWERGR